LNLILSETDDINITADIKSLATTYKISNSEENEKLTQLNNLVSSIYQKFESLKQALQQAQAQQDINAYNQAMQAQYQLDEQRKVEIRNFIDENLGYFV